MAYRVDRLYSYIVNHDTGFAPNPFGGTCTLACCKPKIRRAVGTLLREGRGDGIWIVGLTPSRRGIGNDVVYVMRAEEALSFEEYWERFPEKRPDFSKKDALSRCGDNIYRPDGRGGFRQLRSMHSESPFDDEAWAEKPKNTAKDLGGGYVLASRSFAYWGSKAAPLPEGLRTIRAGRGHRCRFEPETLRVFSAFVEGCGPLIERGSVLADPRTWPRKKDGGDEDRTEP